MGFLARLLGREERGFAERLARALRRRPEIRRVDRDRDHGELKVTRRDGGVHTVNLANGEQEYLALPAEERDAFVAHWVHNLLDGEPIPSSWDEARRQLMPQVRSDDLATVLRLHARTQSAERPVELVTAPLAAGLCVCFVVDEPTRMGFVTEEHVRGWGVTVDELLGIALANLRAATPHPLEWLDSGLLGSPHHDCYDASRLLLAGWLRSAPVDGEALVAAPTRDTLLVAGRDRASTLLAEAEAAFRNEPRPISPCAFVVGDDTVTPFAVEPSDPLWPAVHRSEVLDLGHRYGEQKGLLERLNQAQGVDVHVAQLMAFEHPEHGVHSLCLWASGVHGWLPRADHIRFQLDDDPEHALHVAWDDAQPLVGHRMRLLPDLVPPRWGVATFPTPEEVERLRAVAVAEEEPGAAP